MTKLSEATMLYRKGTQALVHGVKVDMLIVDACEVDTYLENGWYRTPAEAKAGVASIQEPPALQPIKADAPLVPAVDRIARLEEEVRELRRATGAALEEIHAKLARRATDEAAGEEEQQPAGEAQEVAQDAPKRRGRAPASASKAQSENEQE